jgi:NADH dehydrogenase [ubiquinone] 1 alpha subcomplex assembly factor 5
MSFVLSIARRFPFQTRSLASVSANSVSPYQVFDRNAKTLQKNRAVARNNGESSRTVDYVRDEIADRMMERLEVRVLKPIMLLLSMNLFIQDIKRKFATIVDLGSGPGHFSKLLDPETTKKVIMIDSSGMSFLLNVTRYSYLLSEKTLHRDRDCEFDGSSWFFVWKNFEAYASVSSSRTYACR